MSVNPEQLRYRESHEWAYVSDSAAGVVTVGISAFAVAELNDIVFMALPKVGTQIGAGEEFGEVESVKAVSSLFAPVSGEIVAANDDLVNRLDTLNADPYEAGWIIKIKMSNPAELEQLLDWAAYQKQCGGSH